MKRTTFLLLTILLMGVFFTTVLIGQVPQLSNYQGVLTEPATGNPVADDSYSIRFSIYSNAAGGSALWTETQTVQTINGRFNVLLGSVTTLPLSLFDGSNRYLGVKVGSDDEMMPRKRIVSVGYAIKAYDADKLDGKDGSAFAPANHNHNASYYTESELNTSDGNAPNNGSNRVSWNNLKDVPAGFVDGTDDVGSGGSGISQINVGDGMSVNNASGPTATLNLKMGHNNRIDADMVDGKHAGDFAVSSHNHFGETWKRDNVELGIGVEDLFSPNNELVGFKSKGARTAFQGYGEFTGLYCSGKSWGVVAEGEESGGVSASSNKGTAIFATSLIADGLHVSQAGRNGVCVDQANNYGIYLKDTKNTGFRVDHAGRNGLTIIEAGFSGVHVGRAQDHGVRVDVVQVDGFYVGVCYSHGVDVGRAGGSGVNVDKAQEQGFCVEDCGSHGVQVKKAGGNGVDVGRVAKDGFRVENANLSGLYVAHANGDALRIQSTDHHALHIHENVGGDYIRAGNNSDIDFRVTNNGTAYADGGWQGAADFAELIELDDHANAFEPGDVIAISQNKDRSVTLCSQPYSTGIMGVYSTKPGFVGSTHPVSERLDNEIPVAITGIVPCKVSTENGPVRRGDLLTSSTTPGYAMKATDPKIGTVLGKAMGNLESGQGVIEILVILQ